MTFLNPTLLIGLIAGIIPTLLHLLNLRKLKNINFSSLRFLKELQSNQIRKIEIKQWLLLIVRTLIIIFLVLAFSRPLLESNYFAGNNSKTSAIILIDDSQSMMRFNENGIFFEQAKKVSKDIISTFKKEDEVIVSGLGIINNSLTKINNFKQSEIDKIESSNIRNLISEAVISSNKVLNNSSNTNKEFFIITDNQKTNLSNFLNKTGTKYFNNQTKIYFVNLENNEFNNSGINNVKVENAILRPNSLVNLSVSVTNSGKSINTMASIFFNNKRVAQKIINLNSNETKIFPFEILNYQNGLIDGRVEIEKDEIELDNNYYFSFNIPKIINLGFINHKPIDDDVYLTTALKTISKIDSQTIININYTTNFNELNKYDVLIISSTNNFSESDNFKINNYLQSGGGIIFLPNDNFDINIFNHKIFKDLSELSIISENVKIQKTDFNHPIFSNIFNSDKIISEFKINKLIALKNETKTRGIIELSNKKQLLSEVKIGNGKVLFFGIGSSLNWSELPLKSIFIPVLNQMILYTSKNYNLDLNYKVGKINPIAFDNLENSGDFVLLNNKNEETFIKSLILNSNNVSKTFVHLPVITQTGNYILKNNNSEFNLSVNHDQNETIGIKANEKEIINEFTKLGIAEENIFVVNNPEKINSKIIESRIGLEIWPYLIFVVIILSIIEMIISQTKKKDI